MIPVTDARPSAAPVAPQQAGRAGDVRYPSVIAGASRTPVGRLLDAFLTRTRRAGAAAARMHRPSRGAAPARAVAATEFRSGRLGPLGPARLPLAHARPRL